MIVLSDNDIVLKLAGCRLLNQFFEILEAQNQDILITPKAGYALPKQANKKLKDDSRAILEVKEFVKNVGRTPVVNNDLLDHIQRFEDMDGGESLLVLVAYQNAEAIIATGDKRCLKSLINNQSQEPISDIFQSLKNRVYCLESAILLLVNELGFNHVNRKVVNCLMPDTVKVLRTAFGNERTTEHAIECLNSYCKDLHPLLIQVPKLDGNF